MAQSGSPEPCSRPAGNRRRSDPDGPVTPEMEVAATCLCVAGYDRGHAEAAVVAAVATHRMWHDEDEQAAYHSLVDSRMVDEATACAVCAALHFPHP